MTTEQPENIDNTLSGKSLKIEQLQKQMKDDIAASYFLGKYYFTVNTGMYRAELGLAPGEPVGIELQRKLQEKNIVSLIHEYIHYVHEISSVVGNLELGLDIGLKSTFSHYFEADPGSALHQGIKLKDKKRFELFWKCFSTKDILNGGVVKGEQLARVSNIRYKEELINVPFDTSVQQIKMDVPLITLEAYGNGIFYNQELLFGKFFLYEGLAYELDRLVDRQQNNRLVIKDELRDTEYTVLRNLALFIMPAVQTSDFLVIASLSLAFVDCGTQFIDMMKGLRRKVGKGETVKSVISGYRKRVKDMLSSKQEEFNEAQDEYIAVFRKRTQLFKAFSELAQQAKNAYAAKCNNPAFEVDLIVSGNVEELIDIIPTCDYMYTFRDKDEFRRDFLGTASFDEESSQALKVLIGYDHYQKAHGLSSTARVEQEKPVCCPFYTCCSLQLRLDHGVTICAVKPWRIYEVTFQTDKQFCWYGQAVGELKGHTEA